ncbi:TetR/AcrR family transcriptional regulator [Egibacter rhizosphaerae]|nr:TetR/AcrR family transcriptional regulator [Egibacter rhizosphaerae]
MPRPSRRDDLLRVAGQHFYRAGITATGVDTLVADAGVAKMTLYSNFGSKDELVVAYLEDRDARFFARLEAEIDGRDEPVARALAPVDLYVRYLDERGFRGCAFVNAAAELPDEHPGRAVVARHKSRMLRRWVELIAEAGVDDAETVARECAFVLEGAFALAGLGLVTDGLASARELVRRRLAGD